MTDLSALFDGLDAREIDYVQARANSKSDKEALEAIGLSRGWLRNRDKDDLNQRAFDFKTDNVLKAQIELDAALPDAAKGLVELFKSRNENVRLKAYTEAMDRRMGKPTQKIDQKTEHDGELQVKVEYVNTPYQTAELPSGTSGDPQEPEQV